jgi:hypothetical protein
MDYEQVYRRAFDEAFALNMAGSDGTAEYEAGAREYAAEFAEGEVEVAKSYEPGQLTPPMFVWAQKGAADGPVERMPANACRTCGALIPVRTGARHQRWHGAAR